MLTTKDQLYKVQKARDIIQEAVALLYEAEDSAAISHLDLIRCIERAAPDEVDRDDEQFTLDDWIDELQEEANQEWYDYVNDPNEDAQAALGWEGEARSL